MQSTPIPEFRASSRSAHDLARWAYEELAGQFLIFSEGSPPDHLRCFPLTSIWSMAVDDDLECVEIKNHGSTVGWLVGLSVDLDRTEIAHDSVDLGVDSSPEQEWREICRRFAGSWIYVARRGTEIELRLDACATIGAVYDPVSRKIASHQFMLVGDAYFDRLDQAERAANEVEGDGWFTGGFTAHTGIYRLLPNHGLTTSDFAAVRLPSDYLHYDAQWDRQIDAISAEIRVVVAAITKERRTRVCLTGGNETRAMLAALRPSSDSVEFVTLDSGTSRLDVHLASRLAATFGLDHTHMAAATSKAAEKELWSFSAGHAMAGTNQDYFTSLRPLEGHYLVGGLGGEVGRGFLWPNGLTANRKFSARDILARLKQQATSANVEAVSKWQSNLPPGLDAFQTLDLAYIELRMGPWAFAQPRWKRSSRSVHPLISYPQFQRMLALPPAIRADDRMTRLIIESQWQELLEVPINRYGDWRDAWQKVSRAIARPDRVWRKSRQKYRELTDSLPT